jgi:hypothetical protein
MVEQQFFAPVQGGVSMADINPRRCQAWVSATVIDSAESGSTDLFSQGDRGTDCETDCEMDLETTDDCVYASGNSTNSETCSLTDLSESEGEDTEATTTGVSTTTTSLEAKASEFRESSYRRRFVDFRCMDHRTYLESRASSSSTTPSCLTPSDESSLSDFDSDAEADLSLRTASSCRSPSATSKVDRELQLVISALTTGSNQPKIDHGVSPGAQTKRTNKSDNQDVPSRKAVGVRHVRFAPGSKGEELEVNGFDSATDSDTVTDDDDDEGDSESAFEMDEDSDDESDVDMHDVTWTEAHKLWK